MSNSNFGYKCVLATSDADREAEIELAPPNPEANEIRAAAGRNSMMANVQATVSGGRANYEPNQLQSVTVTNHSAVSTLGVQPYQQQSQSASIGAEHHHSSIPTNAGIQGLLPSALPAASNGLPLAGLPTLTYGGQPSTFGVPSSAYSQPPTTFPLATSMGMVNASMHNMSQVSTPNMVDLLPLAMQQPQINTIVANSMMSGVPQMSQAQYNFNGSANATMMSYAPQGASQVLHNSATPIGFVGYIPQAGQTSGMPMTPLMAQPSVFQFGNMMSALPIAMFPPQMQLQQPTLHPRMGPSLNLQAQETSQVVHQEDQTENTFQVRRSPFSQKVDLKIAHQFDKLEERQMKSALELTLSLDHTNLWLHALGNESLVETDDQQKFYQVHPEDFFSKYLETFKSNFHADPEAIHTFAEHFTDLQAFFYKENNDMTRCMVFSHCQHAAQQENDLPLAFLSLMYALRSVNYCYLENSYIRGIGLDKLIENCQECQSILNDS